MVFQSSMGRIVEMFSAQGEKVEMEQPVEAKGDKDQLRQYSSLKTYPHYAC